MCLYVDKNHLRVVRLCLAATCALACDSRRIGDSDGKESLNFLVTNWLHRKILEPLLALLRQGISPDRLALCVAIGVVVGNIPILGISTILCAVIALAFRLNLAAIQIVQAAMAPTQLVLIIPFVRHYLNSTESLDQAEANMLRLTAERAGGLTLLSS